MTTVRLERRGSLTLLRLDKTRGNAIDLPLVEDLVSAARDVGADGGVRGVLLSSAHPKLFCPGLDLVTLVDLDRAALEAFMRRFAEMVLALYALPKPVVAAVSGHAVAGGCILALTADWRVLARGAQMGLNEVKVGVPLPWSVALLVKATVSPSALSRVALLGRNVSAEEALSVGLADELADPAGFEEACLARLAEFAEKDLSAVVTTKRYLRASVLAEMKAHEAALVGEFLDGWFSPGTQARIRAIVASLKG
ncbi:MAG: enoyl-CoA hydratase/isomerase family protein [Vicinamibacteria bacterium]